MIKNILYKTILRPKGDNRGYKSVIKISLLVFSLRVFSDGLYSWKNSASSVWRNGIQWIVLQSILMLSQTAFFARTVRRIAWQDQPFENGAHQILWLDMSVRPTDIASWAAWAFNFVNHKVCEFLWHFGFGTGCLSDGRNEHSLRSVMTGWIGVSAARSRFT